MRLLPAVCILTLTYYALSLTALSCNMRLCVCVQSINSKQKLRAYVCVWVGECKKGQNAVAVGNRSRVEKFAFFCCCLSASC